MKKTLAWLLTLFMVLTISSVTVFAAGTDVAKIGDVGYSSFEAALNAVQDGETITILDVEGSENKEIEFTKAISFTITGTAPNYALPTVTFQNATVTIKDAEILIPELDARQSATINVVDSIVHDAGGDSIVKSYYNGAINISGTSKVYTMQVTTMGYITVSDAAELHATWQTNVYGNGMITVENTAKFNTAALHLTGQDYSDRDNFDADRVGKPATIIVDGATFTVGKVSSNNGADYSYNSSKGINIGTVDGKSAELDIKNGAKVEIHMANGETANIGADGIVNVDGELTVACRSTDGTATLVNNGTVNVSGESTLNVATLTGNTIDFLDGAIIKDSTIGGKVFVAGKVTFRGDNTFGMLFDFGTLTDYYGTTANMEWSVDAGASVTLTNEDRYGLGYGDKVTISGSLTDAKTARDSLSKDDIAVFMHGLVAQENPGIDESSSLAVENAYVVLGKNNSFGNKPGNYGGTYTFTFDNVVLDSSRITFYAADSKTNFTFNKSDVKVGTFMIRDTDTVFTLKNTKLVSTTDTNGSDEGNYLAGTLVLNESSSLSYVAPLVMENGTLTLDKTSSLTAPEIIGTGKIVIDTTGMTAGEVTLLAADLSGFDGTVEVDGDESLYATIEDGKIYLKNFVAMIGDNYYGTIKDAVAALKANGETIKLIADINESITLNYPAAGAPTELIIDLNGFTVTSEESTLWVSDGYAVTVQDSSEAKTGKIISTNSNGEAIAITRDGKVTLSGGHIYNPDYAVYLYTNGDNNTFIMNGGTIEVNDGGVALYVETGTATVNAGKVICKKTTGGWAGYAYSGTINVTGGELPQEEINAYIARAKEKYGREPQGIDIRVDGDFVELSYDFGHTPFQRIRRITGYLVGTTGRWNSAKLAELEDRVVHK